MESGQLATLEAMYMEAKECGGGVAENTDRFNDGEAGEQEKKKKKKPKILRRLFGILMRPLTLSQ